MKLKMPDNSSTILRDSESLFRTKPISEIRRVEASTKSQIAQKQQELRQLVGDRYRDLIDSADSVVRMQSSSESVSLNLSRVDSAIRSLTPTNAPKLVHNPTRTHFYAIATRVKYLVDTPESIWGCLDEFMFFEASGRYLRAKLVYGLINSSDPEILTKFVLLYHQWQIVESFKSQISQRARERLMDRGFGVGPYADALSAVATIDELSPQDTLTLFLDSRRSWIHQKLSHSTSQPNMVTISELLCDIVTIIQVTLGHVGELFLQVLNDMPLFYKTVLGAPPGTQLFGGIPTPDEEVRLWKLHREKLETLMVMLDAEFVAQACTSWLKVCTGDIVCGIRGIFLSDAIKSGSQLSSLEKMIRTTINSREVLEGSLEWLRSVFGSEIGSPWERISELVLRDDIDLWDEFFEQVFAGRMKNIIDAGFDDLINVVNVMDSVRAIVADPGQPTDFLSYIEKAPLTGSLWFLEPDDKKTCSSSGFTTMPTLMDFENCLTKYLGFEVSQIKNLVDSRCQGVLSDFLCFLESPKSASRLRELVPHLQDKCFKGVSAIVTGLEDELELLEPTVEHREPENKSLPPAVAVERSLFIGRLLFALKNHSRYIPVVLGSPRLWWETETKVPTAMLSPFGLGQSISRGLNVSPVHDGSVRCNFDVPIKQSSLASTASWVGVEDGGNSKLEELRKTLRDLCIKAHTLWMTWVTDELCVILTKDLQGDESLSTTSPLRGWEEIIIRHEQPNDHELEMKIVLPSLPSLYIISLLFRACQEISRVGGHVLDKFILKLFASILLEKVLVVYKGMISRLETKKPQVSEKGILQILLDLQFTMDVLSGGMDQSFDGNDANVRAYLFRSSIANAPIRKDHVMGLLISLSQRLDPIDWETYKPYLWDNVKQAYQRHAVLFGFIVQLNRMHMDTSHKLSTNSESNIMRCSAVPRFKYLPISAPALSSRGSTMLPRSAALEVGSPINSWKSHGETSSKLEFDDSVGFGVATPLFKSFMSQVGSKFGESTMKLGSMLTDSQVRKLKEKSVISTFGDMFPVQAAGLLSSFTVGSGGSDY